MTVKFYNWLVRITSTCQMGSGPPKLVTCAPFSSFSYIGRVEIAEYIRCVAFVELHRDVTLTVILAGNV